MKKLATTVSALIVTFAVILTFWPQTNTIAKSLNNEKVSSYTDFQQKMTDEGCTVLIEHKINAQGYPMFAEYRCGDTMFKSWNPKRESGDHSVDLSLN
ncbi:hypothetical protein [Photobacterium profundum]|nr:hypothetical protein [Photobacterium profundum]